MTIKGFHHVAVFTDDLARSVKFYEALGGKKVHSFISSSGKEIDIIELSPGAAVELIQKPAPHAEGSFPHVAVLTDDAEALYRAALSAGATVDKPLSECMLGTMKVKNAFLFGPDGELIEPFEIIS